MKNSPSHKSCELNDAIIMAASRLAHQSKKSQGRRIDEAMAVSPGLFVGAADKTQGSSLGVRRDVSLGLRERDASYLMSKSSLASSGEKDGSLGCGRLWGDVLEEKANNDSSGTAAVSIRDFSLLRSEIINLTDILCNINVATSCNFAVEIEEWLGVLDCQINQQKIVGASDYSLLPVQHIARQIRLGVANLDPIHKLKDLRGDLEKLSGNLDLLCTIESLNSQGLSALSQQIDLLRGRVMAFADEQLHVEAFGNVLLQLIRHVCTLCESGALMQGNNASEIQTLSQVILAQFASQQGKITKQSPLQGVLSDEIKSTSVYTRQKKSTKTGSLSGLANQSTRVNLSIDSSNSFSSPENVFSRSLSNKNLNEPVNGCLDDQNLDIAQHAGQISGHISEASLANLIGQVNLALSRLNQSSDSISRGNQESLNGAADCDFDRLQKQPTEQNMQGNFKNHLLAMAEGLFFFNKAENKFYKKDSKEEREQTSSTDLNNGCLSSKLNSQPANEKETRAVRFKVKNEAANQRIKSVKDHVNDDVEIEDEVGNQTENPKSIYNIASTPFLEKNTEQSFFKLAAVIFIGIFASLILSIQYLLPGEIDNLVRFSKKISFINSVMTAGYIKDPVEGLVRKSMKPLDKQNPYPEHDYRKISAIPTSLKNHMDHNSSGQETETNNENKNMYNDNNVNKSSKVDEKKQIKIVESEGSSTNNASQSESSLKSAAEEGNPQAMHSLAVIFSKKPNNKIAQQQSLYWFSEAASYGVKNSQYNLGYIYANGIGVKIDLIEAYKWLQLAALQGDSEAAKLRDSIERKMLLEQIDIAKKSVGEFVVKKPVSSFDKLARQ